MDILSVSRLRHYFRRNDSTIFLGNKGQTENEEQEFVWCLYRQLSGRPWASQTHLESTPIDIVVSLISSSHLQTAANLLTPTCNLKVYDVLTKIVSSISSKQIRKGMCYARIYQLFGVT